MAQERGEHPGTDGATPFREYFRRSRLHAAMARRKVAEMSIGLMPTMRREHLVLRGAEWKREAEWQLKNQKYSKVPHWRNLIDKIRRSRSSAGIRGWESGVRAFNEGLCSSLRCGHIKNFEERTKEEAKVARNLFEALSGLGLSPKEVMDLAPVWEVLAKEKRGVSSDVFELLKRACHKLLPGSDDHALFVYKMSEVLRVFSHGSSKPIATFLTGLTQRGIAKKYDYRRPVLLAGIVMESFSRASGLSPINLAPPERMEGLSEEEYQTLHQVVSQYAKDKAMRVLIDDLQVEERTARKLLSKCTLPEAEFLSLVALYYRKSPELLKEFWTRIAAKGDMALKIYKRGTDLEARSSLTLVEVPPYVFFVRKMDWEAGGHWLDASERGTIPLEPVISWAQDEDDRLSLLTRYCGPSLRQLTELSVYLKSFGYECAELDKLLYAILHRSVQDIQSLATLTDHKHPHPGNITVEFAKRSHYRVHKDRINDASFYDPAMVHFDVLRYLRNIGDPGAEPEEMVVRFIDFDKAGAPAEIVRHVQNRVLRTLVDTLRR